MADARKTSETARLAARLEEAGARLGGVTLDEGQRPSAEQVAAEVNGALDALERGDFESLDFADSRGIRDV